MEAKMGEAAKDSDEYVELQTGIMKTLSEAQRVSHMLNQSTGLVRKYGSRAHVIGKLDRKLNMVDTAMEIKIADFEVSIDMLKKEFAFAAGSQTKLPNRPNRPCCLQKDGNWNMHWMWLPIPLRWTLLIPKENLLDLDTLTSQYSMDSDELYTNWISWPIRSRLIIMLFLNQKNTPTPITNFRRKIKWKAKDSGIFSINLNQHIA